MRKNLFAGILIFMISTNILAKDLVVATYDNGKQVKDSEIMMKYPSLASQPQFKGKNFTELDPRLQEALVKNYITDILITEEARKSNIQDSKAFQEKIEYIKQQLPKEMFLEQMIQKSVSDKQIDEEYNKIVKDLKGKKRIKLSHILIADEKTAKEAKGKIDKGSSFIEICQQYSIDANSKVNACSLGVLNQGQLVEEFEKVAFSMKIGTISEPVQTQFGWHIIKVDDKLDAIIPPKVEVVEAIKDNIYKKALEQYINNLLTQFKVQITLPKQTMQEIKK